MSTRELLETFIIVCSTSSAFMCTGLDGTKNIDRHQVLTMRGERSSFAVGAAFFTWRSDEHGKSASALAVVRKKRMQGGSPNFQKL